MSDPEAQRIRSCAITVITFGNAPFVQVFHDVAYKAKDRGDLLAGIDEFLDQVTVLPPGEWDPTIRIEPPKSVPSQVRRTTRPGAVWREQRCHFA